MKLLVLSFLLFALAQSALAEIKVAVSIVPHAGLVEAVGGEHIELTILVDEGQDPHEFTPTPRRVTAISNADVWFTAGMPFEQLLAEKITETTENLQLLDLTKGLALRGMEEHDHDHGHDHSHDQAHGDFDPHTWLSPQLVELQLQTIASELSALDPDHADVFEANAEAFTKKIIELDQQLLARLEPLAKTKFYVFHSAFGYFADAYGLEEIAIETGGREPSPKQLTRIIADAKKDGVKLILVQPQFSQGGAERIAEAIGAKLTLVDPLGRDVLATLRSLAKAIEESR
ncbi:MAG: zinc transport system substrate-binding protein [Verrucomicrobiales bacterium]|jgi:zinc transport system substrate-binding protein